jgi:hypothetical protein
MRKLAENGLGFPIKVQGEKASWQISIDEDVRIPIPRDQDICSLRRYDTSLKIYEAGEKSWKEEERYPDDEDLIQMELSRGISGDIGPSGMAGG